MKRIPNDQTSTLQSYVQPLFYNIKNQGIFLELDTVES